MVLKNLSSSVSWAWFSPSHAEYNPPQMSLLSQVRQFIEVQALLQQGDVMVVGVSGGPDSLCLLDLFCALAPEWRLTLHVAHLDHGLRPEASAEAEMVRAQSLARGLPFHTEQVDTQAYAQQHKLSLEEAARELRYQFFARVAVSVGTPLVAVAHTRDDQAETVLMHFLRGAGVAGLRGMLAKTHLQSQASQPLILIRPLLHTPRSAVEAYCAERQLHPVHDASNLDPAFFRNRLRHELLPLLQTYNPNVHEVLSRAAEVFAGDYALLQNLATVLWERLAQVEDQRVRFERAAWLALSVPEQRWLLRQAVQHLRPARRDVDFTPLENALHFSLVATPGRQCDLLAGLCLSVSRDDVTIAAWETPLDNETDLPLLTTEGDLTNGWRFVTETLGLGEWELQTVENNSEAWQVEVDEARLLAEGGVLQVRARHPGDRFCPLGLDGQHTKVAEFMLNAHIAPALRDRWPIVSTAQAVVWVAGLRLDDRFKITSTTQTVRRLRFVREEG